MNRKAQRFAYRVLVICLLALWGIVVASAASLDRRQGGQHMSKTDGNPSITILNINTITSFLRSDGQGNHQVDDQAGARYPVGTATCIYEDGFVWGGKTYLDAAHTQPSSQLVRIGGQTYNQGTRAGWVVGSGSTAQATPPSDPGARVYRIRRDYSVAGDDEIKRDAATLNLALVGDVTQAQMDAVRSQYDTDWKNWPVNLGAPYIERNGVPGYQPPPDFGPNFTPDSLLRTFNDDGTVKSPGYDEPGFAGIDPNSPADQVIWTVYNDLNDASTIGLYNSHPIGLEGQVTQWAYKRTDALGNLYFKKIRLINKGGVDVGGGTIGSFYIDSMYISQWSDPDVGDSGDDLCGSDTTLSLGFAYNGNPVDAEYRKFSLPPPAVGYDFLKGPNNLPMTAFVYFSAGSPISDPDLANVGGASYASSLQWWRMLRGLRPDLESIPERYYPFPPGITPGPFCLTGDPVTHTGFVDGLGADYSFPPGDRRIILCSGPFSLAPGDTQEVVVGTVAGLGSDRLSSVSVMKFNDRFVQNTFDADFAVPRAPKTPKVNYTELDGHVIFEWGSDLGTVSNIENTTTQPGNYTFEGYNVYQLPSASSTLDQAKRIATYDLITDPAVVLDEQFDQASGQILLKPVQFGTNSGISRFFDFTKDYVKDIPRLNDGSPYTIAITAYTVTRSGYLPASLESSPFLVTVMPHVPNPGVTYGPGPGQNINLTHQGTADGGPKVTLVNPGATTGHSYESYFSERQEIRDPGGNWIPSSTISRRVRGGHHGNQADSLDGSSIDISAVYGVTTGSTELRFTLNLNSSDFDYADGIRLSMPAGMTVVDVPVFTAGNTAAVSGGVIEPAIAGNIVALGDTTHPYTGNGAFAGGEQWIAHVNGLVLPSSIDWKIFDDGYGGNPTDAEGTTIVTAIGNVSRLAKYWNLKDATTGEVKLENQSVVSGIDIFPRRDDIPVSFGTGADPIVDGYQISMLDVVYDAPINFLSTTLTPGPGSTTSLTHSSSVSTLDIQNYTIFGGTITSKSIDNFGAGTSDINQLQKDYELRFTGVPETTLVGGRTIVKTGTGGQMATIFGTVSGVGAGLDSHPLNPSPGSNTPFLIRIPFEVWSIDDNRQVNLTFRDRSQSLTADPFFAWNPTNRMYAVLENSAYNETTPTPPDASATWVLVFYGTNYHLGDVVTVKYANPVQVGTDAFTFSTTQATTSTAQAKADVSRINVFPNPYYAFNPLEISRTSRFVRFNHLPQKATIRIFNLAGQLVRTLQKDTPSQFFDWNLANEDNFPVASGMYIVHVDMPDLGATKVLKVAIIQEQEVPNNF